MTGLVGWWPLHEQSGDAADLSGNNNTGTVNGATQGVAGKGGLTAYSFDGSDDYIDIDEGRDSQSVYTFTAWVNANTLNSEDTVISLSNTQVLAYEFKSSNGFNSAVFDGSSWSVATSGVSATNEWLHLAYQYDGSDLRIFVNGAESGLTTGVAPRAMNSEETIGARFINGSNFNGTIADVRIYNRALSQSEIQTLYEWGAAGLGSIPEQDRGGVSYYKLDGDTVDSWGDNGGSVSGATLGVSGIRNTAYSFDGGGDVITIPHDSSLDFGTTSFSTSVWIKTTSTTDGRILHKGNATGRWWAINYNQSSNQLQYFFDDGSSTVSVNEDISRVSTGNWHHMVFTLNRESDLTGYIDGKSIGSTDATGLGDIDTGADLEVGADPTESIYFEGDIDEIRIYDRALGADEVKALYSYDNGGDLLGELADPPTDMIGYYKLDGNASDSAGTQDGTVNGATVTSDAIRGTAYEFNGTSDFINMGGGTTLSPSNITVSAWIKPDDADGGRRVVAKDGANQAYQMFLTSGDVVFRVWINGGVRGGAFSAVNLDEWQHVVGTYDGSEVVGYFNGIKTVITEQPGTIDEDNGNFVIGKRSDDPQDYFDGIIDDVRIYSRALTESEVNQLYQWGTLGRDMRELTVNAR